MQTYRSRKSTGSLTIRNDVREPYWQARYYATIAVKDGVPIKKQIPIKIGPVALMTEGQARAVMQDKIRRAEVTRARLANIRKHDAAAALVPARSKGIYAETMVTATLIRSGFEVYRAVNPCGECDLIMVDESRHVSFVEVKFGNVESGRPICDAARNAGKFDILAVVTNMAGIHFFDSELRPMTFSDQVRVSTDPKNAESANSAHNTLKTNGAVDRD